MQLSESTEQPTLAGQLPLAHIRVDMPVLDADPVLGFSLRGTDVEGRIIVQLSWSRGAFPTMPDVLDQLARELLELLRRASSTLG